MWTLVLSAFGWFCKLSWVSKVISWFPSIKQYWYFIVIGGLVIWVGVLKFENLRSENKYLKCQTIISDFQSEQNKTKAVQDTKKEAVAVQNNLTKENAALKKELAKVKIREVDNNDKDAILGYMYDNF
jgi:ABC-type amino acid transport substrate-binding protein